MAAIALSAGVLSFGAARDAAATLLIEQDFQSPVDSIPDGWTAFNEMATQSIKSWGYAGAPANGLKMVRGAAGSQSGVVYYSGAGATLTNVTGSVLLGVSGSISSSSAGVLVRNTTLSGNTANGYYFFIRDTNSFGISRSPDTHTTEGTVLAEDFTPSNFSITTAMKMEFSAIGSALSAKLYAWDSVGSNWDEIGAVSATDTTFAGGGRVGLRVGSGNTNRGAYFSDLEVIPEPASVGLLIVAGAAVWRRMRPRRMK